MSESTSEKPRGVLLPVPAHITQRQLTNALAVLGFDASTQVESLQVSKYKVIVRVVYVTQAAGIRSNQIAEVVIPVVEDGGETRPHFGRRP